MLKPYRRFCTQVSIDLCKTEKEYVLVGQIAQHFTIHWAKQNQFYQAFAVMGVVLVAFLLEVLMNPYLIVFAIVLALGNLIMTSSKNIIKIKQL